MTSFVRFFNTFSRMTRSGGQPLTLMIVGVAAIALFLGLFLSAQAALFFLLAAWVVAGSWRFPFPALLLLLFFAPLLPLLKATQIASLLTPLKDFVILTLFVRTTLLPMLRKQDPYRRNTLLLPLLFFGAWCLLGALRADHLVLGLLRLRDLFLYIPLLWVARSLVRNREDLRAVFTTLGLSATLVLVIVGLQFALFPDGMVLRFDPAAQTWFPRASGTLAHPNILSSYLLFIAPLAIAAAADSALRGRTRLLAGGLGLLATFAVYCTYSRSGWIALAVALVVLFVLMTIRRLRTLIMGGALGIFLLAVLLFALPTSRALLRTVVDPTYRSNEERLLILAQLVADTSNTDALLGRGLGDVLGSTMRSVTISLGDIAAADVREVQIAKARTFVDNAVLKTGIELGFFGVLIVGWLGWTVLRLGVQRARDTRLPEGRILGRAAVATTVGLGVLAFFLDVPEIFPVALLFWTFVGLLQSLPYLDRSSSRHDV